MALLVGEQASNTELSAPEGVMTRKSFSKNWKTMMPYRDKPVDELRVRRKVRRYKRVSNRILARAEARFKREEYIHNALGVCGLLLLSAFMCASLVAFIQAM